MEADLAESLEIVENFEKSGTDVNTDYQKFSKTLKKNKNLKKTKSKQLKLLKGTDQDSSLVDSLKSILCTDRIVSCEMLSKSKQKSTVYRRNTIQSLLRSKNLIERSVLKRI